MNLSRIYRLIKPAAMVIAMACNPVAMAESPGVAGGPLSIESLYTIPSLIGTVPGGVTWSSDARQLAFLWNDEGGTFRDIWVYNIAEGKTRQLSRHARNVDVSLEHKGVGEVSWFGPGAQLLAYTLDGQLLVSDGNGKARTIATGLSGVNQLQASPDGKSLSFVGSNPETSGEALWMLEYAEGELGKPQLLLDPGHVDSSVKSHQWSKDGSKISFELEHQADMARREIHYYRNGELQVDTVIRAFPGEPNVRFSVGVIDRVKGESHLLRREDDSYPIWGYGLSDSGDRLFVNESDPSVKLHRIEMYDLISDKRETFYSERDPRHLRPDWKVAWAPDDQGLVILTDKDGYLHLYYQRTAAEKPVRLTAGDWEISDFSVADESGEIYFRANKSQAAERQLYRVSLEGGEVTRVSAAKGGTHHITYAPDMGRAASVFSSDDTPHDLYLINFEDLGSQRLTESPEASFYQQRWAEVRYIHFDSHVDGAPLIGRLSLPPDFDASKQYPLIVGSVYSDSVRNQWGGRTSHPTWGLDQHLVAQGYILLNVNVRGSWGQGREHNQGLLHGYGNVDIDDLHSGVLYLIKEGYADPDRVGIWGSSYGGLMTMMSLFKKPGVYAAGIAGAPATNVAHAYPEQMWVMGPATGKDMPARYQKQSPLYHTDGLRDPLMIIHGSRDQVVLYSDTIAVANRLIAQEQPFELVTLPGAGHGWDAQMNDQRRFSFIKMVDFFNRHVKGSGE